MKWTLVFFIPVVLVYVLLEVMVLEIPMNYKNTSDYFNSEKDEIEILALGPSQTNNAINPEYFDKKAISLASTSQHHNLDFKILTQMKDRLPKLKYVILEVSYSHLEYPHNSKDFWKNSVYLKYYDINAFERNTYFKDKLIFLARPDVYSNLLINHYIKRKEGPRLNKYGFDTNRFKGVFSKLDYNDAEIIKKDFSINIKPNKLLFKKNTEFLYEMLDYTKDNSLNVIVCTMPLYKTYLKARNPDILGRRDSVLKVITKKYDHVKLFQKENDTLLFKTTDFLNHNHLNPNGAEKFSKALNSFINEQFED